MTEDEEAATVREMIRALTGMKAFEIVVVAKRLNLLSDLRNAEETIKALLIELSVHNVKNAK